MRYRGILPSVLRGIPADRDLAGPRRIAIAPFAIPISIARAALQVYEVAVRRYRDLGAVILQGLRCGGTEFGGVRGFISVVLEITVFVVAAGIPFYRVVNQDVPYLLKVFARHEPGVAVGVGEGQLRRGAEGGVIGAELHIVERLGFAVVRVCGIGGCEYVTDYLDG